MKAIRTIHNTIEQLTLGQMIDVDMMVGDQVEKEKLEKKNYYKSAIYTFSKPLVV
jgi:geranylgeranyl pyrophosphate synthase